MCLNRKLNRNSVEKELQKFFYGHSFAKARQKAFVLYPLGTMIGWLWERTMMTSSTKSEVLMTHCEIVRHASQLSIYSNDRKNLACHSKRAYRVTLSTNVSHYASVYLCVKLTGPQGESNEKICLFYSNHGILSVANCLPMAWLLAENLKITFRDR